MRHDRKAQLDYYLDKGADFQTAFELVTTSAVGVVMATETKWPDGNAKDPPHGWTWKQVAQKRALKTALNMSHGMPTVAQLARKSWEVAGVITKPEDWDGTDELKTQDEKERLAAMQALERERRAQWEDMTVEEKKIRTERNSTLLYGEDTDDPFADGVIEGEAVELDPEAPMTLREALDVGLPKAAPKLELDEGTPLLNVVRRNARDLIEYLTKSSSYDEPSEYNMLVQEAAKLIFGQWDMARDMVMSDKEREVVGPEEMQVAEGETAPLF